MSYEQKYLKYKEKYLKYKYILSGGSIHDWMRNTPNGWEELRTIKDGPADIQKIDEEVEKVKKQPLPNPIVRQQRTTKIILPSGRHIIIHYTDHQDGFQIDRIEYNGAQIKSDLKKGLNKFDEFIRYAIGFRGEKAYFDTKQEAIDYITSNYTSIVAHFKHYKHKPTLVEIIGYIQSPINIQDLKL
jgi:hypothetical protein